MTQKTVLEIGKKYYRLTLVSLSHKDKHGALLYNFVCDCGTNKAIELRKEAIEKRKNEIQNYGKVTEVL